MNRAPARHSGGHGFDSCWGLRFFRCPTLASCWSIHLSRHRLCKNTANTEKEVENMAHSRLFLGNFKLFRNLVKDCRYCLVYFLNRNLSRGQRYEVVKKCVHMDVHIEPGWYFSLLNLLYPTFSQADGRAGAGSQKNIPKRDRHTDKFPLKWVKTWMPSNLSRNTRLLLW